MKNRLTTFMLACSALLLLSCGDSSTSTSRSAQYMPNMYQSIGYETYQEADIFPGGVVAQKPVQGTIPRGWMPYEFEDSNEGYELAKSTLENPLAYTEENLSKGKELYGIYCAICHGDKGDGNGHLSVTGKFEGIPSYDSRELTQGSIYHVMYWGKNYMGSYASQTSIEERWQIAHHVDALTRALKKEEPKSFEEEIIVIEDKEVTVTLEGNVVTGSYDENATDNQSSNNGE